MKLVGCRHCGELVIANERSCPFCGGVLAEPKVAFAACAVLAGLVLGGCVSRVETPIEGETESESETDTPNVSSSGQTPDLPNSEATYGVPGTDSDWYGTETDGPGTTTGDLPNSEATYGVPGTDSDWWSTESDGETMVYTDTDTDTDGDTDTDTDGTATGVASSDAG